MKVSNHSFKRQCPPIIRYKYVVKDVRTKRLLSIHGSPTLSAFFMLAHIKVLLTKQFDLTRTRFQDFIDTSAFENISVSSNVTYSRLIESDCAIAVTS